MNRFFALLMLGCLSLPVSTTFAAPATAPATTPATSKSILELMTLTGTGNLGVQALHSLLPSLKASAPDVPPEFWDDFMKEVDPNELVNLTVPIYMRHFTENEIQEMIRFYKTPTGQKLVQKQPQVMQESMQAGQLWAQGLAQRVLERSMQSR